METPICSSPLAACHAELGARMINFGGWNLPVEYSGLLLEHQATRQAAGLFDISHMGQIRTQGAGALAALESLLTNDPAKLRMGEGHYTFLTNDQGGVIDDLLLYRLGPEDFLLVVNASRHQEDLSVLRKDQNNRALFQGDPGTKAGMALQGPRAEAILSKLLPAGETSPLRNTLKESQILGIPATIARTGYTGEDGFEIFTSLEDGPKIWRALLEKGKPMGILPCGLGARDSLRLEAGLPLNGQDLSPEITPIEAGLGFFVDLSRPRPFPGRAQLEQAKINGARRTTIGLVGQPKQAPPRHGYPVFLSGKQIGEITSGVPSPTLGYGVALALITNPAPACGQDLEFEVRGRRVPAKVSSRKFLLKK